MRIEPISYQPYIYKPSAIDSNSLSKVKRIGDDLLSSKTDFSGLEESQETTNPLRRGETIHFTDVLNRQMQMGRMNADRIMKPVGQGIQEIAKTTKPSEEQKTQEAAQKEKQSEQSRQSNISSYQMQRAAEAYQMFMIA